MSPYRNQKLNLAEKNYIKKHPIRSYIVNDLRNIALNETRIRFGHNRNNDKSDAFRHCFWSALISKRFGYHEALKITTIHEMKPGNPVAEKSMDLHNNKIGAKIGRNGLNEQTIAQDCYKALENNELIYR